MITLFSSLGRTPNLADIVEKLQAKMLMEKQEMNLIKEQKRDQRLQKWLSPPGANFRNSTVE